MRLLHVFPTFEVGGQQMRAVALANGMTGTEGVAGEPVHNLVLSLSGDFACADKFADDVSWEPVAIPAEGQRGQQRGLAGRVLAARRTIASSRPDLLITYNWGAVEWAAANYLPLCRHIHVEDGFGREEAEGQIRRRVLFRRLVLAPRSRVAFPSRTLYGIARDIWRLPEESLSYIPNGIDLEPFGSVSCDEARSIFNLPPTRLIVGTLATLRPEKNLRRLIDAFHSVCPKFDCHLVIAGDGPERPSLEAYVEELGLAKAVSFPGFIEAPHSILPAFDIFALSSDTEQMPLSIMEAMAAGLPVASVDVGDVRAMVAADCQRFVEGRDGPSLKRSLRTLLDSSDERLKTGAANKGVATREFDGKKMHASWKTLFTGR